PEITRRSVKSRPLAMMSNIAGRAKVLTILIADPGGSPVAEPVGEVPPGSAPKRKREHSLPQQPQRTPEGQGYVKKRCLQQYSISKTNKFLRSTKPQFGSAATRATACSSPAPSSPIRRP